MIIRGCDFPEDRHYHADFNVWVKEASPGIVLLGATSFGAALAEEFVAFLPKADGTAIEPGRAAGLLELYKTIVSVRSPVRATLLGHNAAVVKDPALIRADPYHAGWLLRLDAGDWARESDRNGLVCGPAILPAFEQAMDLENFSGPERR